MIPFPRMNFIMCSYAPLAFQAVGEYRAPTVENLLTEAFHARNMMCSADLRQGRVMAGAVSLRGTMSTSEVEEKISEVKKVQLANSLVWIPDGVMSSICNVSRGKGSERDATFMVNSTSVREIIKRIGEQFTMMFRRKAFLHWYLSEGMDDMEFTEYESHLNDILCEYDLPSVYERDYDEEFIEYEEEIIE